MKTPRLVLRAWEEGDIDRFVEVTNTPAVMRWLGGVMDAERIAALEARVTSLQERLGHTFWVVESKGDGEMLGFCGLKLIDAPGAAFAGEREIGWRLREGAWGKGYAREAATAALDLGFNRFGAGEIFAYSPDTW